MSKNTRMFLILVLGFTLALIFLASITQVAKAEDGSGVCEFQPMPVDRSPTISNSFKVDRGGANITWDKTFIGLHRWNVKQIPGIDYTVNTTVPFKNGAVVGWVGWDLAGGGNSIRFEGYGPCKGWRVFYGHLNYDATIKFKIGDKVGPNEVVGIPGCSGFNCSLTPAHNHTALGFWSNIFSFDDGTNVEQVYGYWWIHPARVEGKGTAVVQQPNVKPENKVTITTQTEFTVDVPMSGMTDDVEIGFIDQIIITFAPFRNIIIVALGLLAIFWLGGIIYSPEFRVSMVPFVIVVVLIVIGYFSIGQVIADSPIFTAPRNTDSSVDIGKSKEWTVSLPTNQLTTQSNPLANPPSQNGCSLPTSYPQSVLRWCSWIESYAKALSIDPRMIAAVMLQESGGNPIILSGSGAVGLLQVMPRDGIAARFHNSAGVPYFADRPSIAELKDPEFNIKYGTNMLHRLGINTNPREALLHYGPDPADLERIYGSRYYYADLILSIYQKYR